MSAHHRPSGKRTRVSPLVDVAGPPRVDWNWLAEVVRLWELRRLLRLSVLDVRRLLGDETRDLTAYTGAQLHSVVTGLRRRLPDPRRRSATQPVINRRLPSPPEDPL